MDWGKYVFQYPAQTQYSYHQVRSGQLWTWTISTTSQLPDEMRFPGLKQMIRIHRQKINKRTGVMAEETHYAISNLSADAKTFAIISRLHWAIENRLHHKRDTVLAEDACRTRKAAQALAAFRNLILGFLHQLGSPVLRNVRSFSANPMPLYVWLNGCI